MDGRNMTGRVVFRSLLAVVILVVLFFLGRPIYWKLSASLTEKENANVVGDIAKIEGGDVADGGVTEASDSHIETATEEVGAATADTEPADGNGTVSEPAEPTEGEAAAAEAAADGGEAAQEGEGGEAATTAADAVAEAEAATTGGDAEAETAVPAETQGEGAEAGEGTKEEPSKEEAAANEAATAEAA